MAEITTLEEAANLLEQSPDFRVLRKLLPRKDFNLNLVGELLFGIILDVETTGLDPDVDEVIELAMTKFSFTREGDIGRVTDIFQSFNEPSCAIPENISALTGITLSDVSGKHISPSDVGNFISDCVIIIAHNASFDRPFAERVAPQFSSYGWACSATEIPWKDEGIVGSRLEYLAQSYSFFYDAHRASEDCLSVLTILSLELPVSKRHALSVLLENARKVQTRLFADGASYDTRTLLKRRKYRWNDGLNGYPRAWWRDLDAADVEQEITFLSTLDPSISPQLFNMTAKTRFRRKI